MSLVVHVVKVVVAESRVYGKFYSTRKEKFQGMMNEAAVRKVRRAS